MSMSSAAHVFADFMAGMPDRSLTDECADAMLTAATIYIAARKGPVHAAECLYRLADEMAVIKDPGGRLK